MDTTKEIKTNQHIHPQRVLGIISSCGGGDWPPLLALAAGMSKRGHEVFLLCDSGTEAAVRKTGVSAICVPQQFNLSNLFNPALQSIFSSGEDITSQTDNPLLKWAEKCIPFILNSMGNWRPTLIWGSLLCLELSAKLAKKLEVPWCFVNPSFCFGNGNHGPFEEDFSRHGVQMYEHWLLPSAQEATVVLHATDPVFDTVKEPLCQNHYYTGPLFWELSTPIPNYLQKSGMPWVLISLSTAPQTGDMEIVKTSLTALKNLPVRVLVTLTPQHDKGSLGELPDNVFIAGYIPHSIILPLCRLAISHAGHGMVLKAIYHGTPMVLVPWGRDQPGVAARAEKLGVASVVNRNNCSTATLARVIKNALTDPNLTLCAKEQSLRLQKEDSLTRACGYLESLFYFNPK